MNFSLNSINVFVFMIDTDYILFEVRTEFLLLEGGLCTDPGPIIVGFGGQGSNGIGLPLPMQHSHFRLLIYLTVVTKAGGRRL